MKCVPFKELETAEVTLLASQSPRAGFSCSKQMHSSISPATGRAQGLPEPGAGAMVASTVGGKPCLSWWVARGSSWGKWADCVAPASSHRRLTGSAGTAAPAPRCTGGGTARGWERGLLAPLELKVCDFWKQGCSLANCRCLLQNFQANRATLLKGISWMEEKGNMYITYKLEKASVRDTKIIREREPGKKYRGKTREEVQGKEVVGSNVAKQCK